MQLTRRGLRILLLAGVVLLSVSCGTAPDEVEPQGPTPTVDISSQAFASPLSTATPIPTMTPVPTLAPEPTPAPLRLVVLHTNDNWGETEPCGWGQNATGGFRRRATYISQQRQQAEHILLLDTGDALTGGGILGDRTGGEAIVAGMNLMGYDAMTLGPRELSLGPDVLARRMEEAKFPILSANVVLTGTDELYAQPYVIKEVGGRQVGVIGLTRVPSKARVGFEVLDPQEAAAQYVAEIADQADVIVILTNLGHQSALDLASSVPGIDLVVAALPGQPPSQVAKAQGTDTLVVCAENPAKRHTGRQVGRLAVTVESDGTLADEHWISKPLTKDIPDDPEMRALLASYGQ